MGRRRVQKKGPRIFDIDILLFARPYWIRRKSRFHIPQCRSAASFSSLWQRLRRRSAIRSEEDDSRARDALPVGQNGAKAEDLSHGFPRIDKDKSKGFKGDS